MKSNAAKIDPPKISLKRTLASGKKTKINPNNEAMTMNVSPEFTQLHNSIYQSLSSTSIRLVNTPIILLTINEAISKKLKPKIIEEEIRRLIINRSEERRV